MEIQTEIQQLEDSMAGKAAPLYGPNATLGRLAELYLQLPNPSQYAPRALIYAKAGADAVKPDDPLYSQLRHFQAMAMRQCEPAEASALGITGEAAAMDRDAIERSETCAPSDAYIFAAQWGAWAWEGSLWEEAAEAYSIANRALRQYISLHVPDPDARVRVLHGTDFGVRSAFAYTRLNNRRRAILELERANAVHFNRHDNQWSIQRLALAHPDVAARLQEAREALASLVQDPKAGVAVDSLGHFSTDATAAHAKVDAIALEIRSLTGFSSFAMPADWNDVLMAAAEAALVYLALTDKGLAVIAAVPSEDGNGKTASWIADVTPQSVRDAAIPFFAPEFGEGAGDPKDALMPLLDWLARNITNCVLSVLAALEYGNKPVALMPTGLLALLPIHLAMVVDPDTHAPTLLLDPRKVKYCYWARGLARSAARRSEHVTTGALVINNPDPLPVEFDPLEMGDFETQAVLSRIPGLELKGNLATRNAVCAGLATANLAHFCCHGMASKVASYSGTLILSYPDSLNYKDLRGLTGVPARLVVLSACRSGAAVLGIDQVLSLPAMFLSMGAVAVLGTFWRTDDVATLLLMMCFYSLWCDSRLDPEVALGDAQLWLQSSNAAALKKIFPPAALELPAAAELKAAADDAIPYSAPWYWAAFFLAGA